MSWILISIEHPMTQSYKLDLMVDLFFLLQSQNVTWMTFFFLPTTHNTTAACIKIYGNNIIVLPFVYSNYICLESFRYLVRFL